MKKFLMVLPLLFGLLMAFLYIEEVPQTPLQNNQYQSLPKSAEISEFLHDLVDESALAKIVTLGQSAGLRDIEAVMISSNPEFLKTGRPHTIKLNYRLTGYKHATYGSGDESVQMIVREILAYSKTDWLKDMNLILIVNENPDGRYKNSRLNEKGHNINIDYIKLHEDESVIFVNAIKKYQPHIILDLHESSVFKNILTKKQGYMNYFDAQFGVNNNPNIDASLNQFSEEVFLPALIKANSDMGVPAKRYQGEILQLKQPIAQAGLRLWNFRNYSAFNGAVSVLVENRLDRRKGNYETPGNIKERTEKQKISVEAFLNTAKAYKNAILAVTEQARNNWSSSLDGDEKIVMLRHQFIVDKENPILEISLKNVKTGKLEIHPFPNFTPVETTLPLALPKAYIITDEHERFAQLFSRHHLSYQVIAQPKTVAVTQSIIRNINTKMNRLGTADILQVETFESPTNLQLNPGDLWIEVNQPMGQLIPILLDPRATDSIFQEPTYRPLLNNNEVFFISRLD